MIWHIFWALIIGVPIIQAVVTGSRKARGRHVDTRPYEERLADHERAMERWERRAEEWDRDNLRGYACGPRPKPPAPPSKVAPKPSRWGWETDDDVWIPCVVTGGFALFIAVIILAVGPWFDTAKADNMAPLIDQRVAVRDELAQLIRDEMSAENYAALMAAVPDADGEIDLRLYVGSGASDVLRDRAARIIQLNREVYDLQGNYIARRVAVCTYMSHPLSPRLPFGIATPKCEVPDVAEVWATTDPD